MISQRPLQFDATEIVDLMAELARRIRQADSEPDIYLVGGAAMSLGARRDRLTQDIDAYYRDQITDEVAREMADDYGLDPRWINRAATPYIPPREHDLEVEIVPGVRVAPDTHLLVMKVAANRQRDHDDMVVLTRRLGISSAQELHDLVLRVYGEGQADMAFGGDWASEVKAVWEQLRAGVIDEDTDNPYQSVPEEQGG